MRQIVQGVFGLVLVAGVLTTACAPVARTLTVAVAADAHPAFLELGSRFEKQYGVRVMFNAGSTGMLAQQIREGAPVDVFASADRSTIDGLAAQGFVFTDTVRQYAQGQLVMWTRADSTAQLAGISDLARPEVRRVAIANPEHAPYGVAARESLENAGVWDIVQPKLVLAENVQQALQFASTGNVDAALVAKSLAMGSGGQWVEVPQNLYRPLNQAIGVIKGTHNEQDARAFAEWVSGPEGRGVFSRFGFLTGDARSP